MTAKAPVCICKFEQGKRFAHGACMAFHKVAASGHINGAGECVLGPWAGGREALRERVQKRSAAPRRRFESRVIISLACYETRQCAGKPMRLVGNLSLREAGEAGMGMTVLGFECQTCFQRVSVHDCWPPSNPFIDALHDLEP